MEKSIQLVEQPNDERPTVSFRTNSVRQKARWERAVEESDEYGSISHLIRRAVERELAGGNDPRDSQQAIDASLGSERLDEISEVAERIESKLNDVSRSVGRIEDRAVAESGLSDETMTDIFSKLAVGEGNAMRQASTAGELAEVTDYDESTVTLALDQLSEDVTSVKKTENPDGIHYFREV